MRRASSFPEVQACPACPLERCAVFELPEGPGLVLVLLDHREMAEQLHYVLRFTQHAGGNPDQREYARHVPERYAICMPIGPGAIRE